MKNLSMKELMVIMATATGIKIYDNMSAFRADNNIDFSEQLIITPVEQKVDTTLVRIFKVDFVNKNGDDDTVYLTTL